MTGFGNPLPHPLRSGRLRVNGVDLDTRLLSMSASPEFKNEKNKSRVVSSGCLLVTGSLTLLNDKVERPTEAPPTLPSGSSNRVKGSQPLCYRIERWDYSDACTAHKLSESYDRFYSNEPPLNWASTFRCTQLEERQSGKEAILSSLRLADKANFTETCPLHHRTSACCP